METEPFNEADYTDEQLVALLGLKAHYADERDILTPHEVQNLKFTKWLIENGALDEFNVSNDAA